MAGGVEGQRTQADEQEDRVTLRCRWTVGVDLGALRRALMRIADDNQGKGFPAAVCLVRRETDEFPRPDDEPSRAGGPSVDGVSLAQAATVLDNPEAGSGLRSAG